jgi:23S rRNA (cytidine1920-2'-O)/16S rRNA (cytidine1409-2'-O)-methyltransferase
MRLDVLLVEKGIAPTREKAKAYVMAGEVYVGGQPAYKPGTPVAADAMVEYRSRIPAYVSRGGYKMAGAAASFGLDFSDRVVLDVGASTGGYTDYALQNGARKVYAVDVGHGQLDWSLRQDPRVVVREKVNARYLAPDQFEEPIDLVMMDVSFISITLILGALVPLLSPEGEIISLVKPQFETDKASVGKKGIVKDKRIHTAVLHKCMAAGESLGMSVAGICYSPLKGAQGNIEYFICLRRGIPPLRDGQEAVAQVVEAAHQALNAT